MLTAGYNGRALLPLRADVLVFAPHPDDETLGTAGVIMRSLAAGLRVHVVIVTNGDAYEELLSLVLRKRPEELAPEDYLRSARIRQQEAFAAAAAIGLPPSCITFLAYPDAGLLPIYKAADAGPFTSRFTGQRATYAALVPDYHRSRFGRPAAYTKACVLKDVTDLICTLQPRHIYMTNEADRHPDHQAVGLFVREAAERAGFAGGLHTYLIHSGPVDDEQWPWPRGVTPTLPFEAHLYDGKRIPEGLPWPPQERMPLNDREIGRKLQAILAYRSQFPVDEELLLSFSKNEEIFWR
ncbi:LmbE family N-acetylglucosaminyl deacetylase [Paenibacillus methanolicus]|uniref:LmbE family N-acetylglucosaminyl deacetylase n=2 Tax=Paenibacillus methanolicus TaxID=582686 RepID=A0A5S5BZ05_9BACL|nr:LmbE family N-acetylglucosaminyl deacetylase [Paenibacillus methanolicus]